MFRKKCDNLLVEADNFTILGLSFCVTQNAFNFIKIKKQEHRSIVKQVLYYPMLYFFLRYNCWFRSYLIKQTHCNRSIVIFDGFWIKICFTLISLFIKVFNLGRILGTHYLYLMSCLCLGIINHLHLY